VDLPVSAHVAVHLDVQHTIVAVKAGDQTICTWAMTHKAWNKLQHALHGNGPSMRPLKVIKERIYEALAYFDIEDPEALVKKINGSVKLDEFKEKLAQIDEIPRGPNGPKRIHQFVIKWQNALLEGPPTGGSQGTPTQAGNKNNSSAKEKPDASANDTSEGFDQVKSKNQIKKDKAAAKAKAAPKAKPKPAERDNKA